MCGILGVFSPNGPIDKFDTEKALLNISHRGPDATGVEYGNINSFFYAIGHTRLSIIDLSTNANQPMVEENKLFTIVYNGEIYNYRELRNQLISLGCNFKTNSDTEVILLGYREWGPSIVDKLDGMFAFIIVDKIKNKVFFARDHLGIKPLYYYFSKDTHSLYIASEIKSILSYQKVNKEVDENTLGEYLANLWVAEPNTMFKNVYKVPAGHFGFFENGNLTIEEYWDLPNLKPIKNINYNEKEILENVYELINNACKKQLVSDVPVGVYISGGVDSSVIANIISKSEDSKIIGLIAGFSEEDQKYEGSTSDLHYARRFVKNYSNIEPFELIMQQTDLMKHYKDLVWHLDEPIADPAIIPSFLLAEKARALGCKVMLSGMGGDELFCGYNRFSVINKLVNMPRIVGNLLYSGTNFAKQFPFSGSLKKKIRDVNRASRFIFNPDALGYQSLIGYFHPTEINNLLGHSNWKKGYQEKYSFKNRNDLDLIKKFLYHDYKGYLASHNLTYSDKSSMAASVEVRVPFLDKQLVEYVWHLDSELLLKNNVTKYLLKKSFEGEIDHDILYRKKAGFSLPIRNWMNLELKEEILELLSNKNSRMFNYIDYYAVQHILKEQYNKGIDKSMEIWILYTLSLWLDKFELGSVPK